MESISRFAANLKISAASPLSKRKASFRFEKEDGRSGYEVFVIDGNAVERVSSDANLPLKDPPPKA